MKISSFGEVLWDDFPEGKVLGGAPPNVLVRRIAAKNVATHLIQTDPELSLADVEELMNPSVQQAV